MNNFQSLKKTAADISNLWKLSAIAALLVAGVMVAGCAKHEHTTTGASATAGAKKQMWHCPMHPAFIQDKPGTCGICAMDLVPVEAGGGTNGIPGRSMIHISPERRQQIGLVTTNVAKREISKSISATVTIEEDETRQAAISPRIGGFVQELYVNALGQQVKRGDKLLKLYSPELLVAEREYFNAVNAGDQALVRAAQRRLALIGLDEEQIDSLQQSNGPSDTIDLRSPVGGTVMLKEVKQGESFAAGQKIYEITDLSHVWLHGFIREPDVADIHTGMTATVTTTAFPNDVFDAHVTFIYPNIDAASRTLEVRLETDNKDAMLKPDMWGTAEFEIDLGEKLVVPADAIIDTGKRFVAFLDKGDGHLEPREVKIGRKTDEFFEVKSGLADGDRVVLHALFLVDAESQLQAAVSGMMQ